MPLGKAREAALPSLPPAYDWTTGAGGSLSLPVSFLGAVGADRAVSDLGWAMGS